jgi:hypothetical protein
MLPYSVYRQEKFILFVCYSTWACRFDIEGPDSGVSKGKHDIWSKFLSIRNLCFEEVWHFSKADCVSTSDIKEMSNSPKFLGSKTQYKRTSLTLVLILCVLSEYSRFLSYIGAFIYEKTEINHS